VLFDVMSLLPFKLFAGNASVRFPDWIGAVRARRLESRDAER
jgi:hypothetical protein